MSERFNWEVSEEAWPETPPAPPTRPPPRRRRLTLAAVALLGLATLVAVTQRRARQAEQSIADDVRASLLLIAEAADRGDEELVAAHLAGDEAWRFAYEALQAGGHVMDLPLLDLAYVPGSLEVADVALNATLNEATITSRRRYRLTSPTASLSSIVLEHTTFHRRQGARWAWAQPPDTFWESPEFMEEQSILFAFAGRAPAVTRALLPGLASSLLDICAGRSANVCRRAEPLIIDFSLDPIRLSTVQATRGFSLAVPSPALVGAPVDEAGRRALTRSYADLVETTLLTQHAGGGHYFDLVADWTPDVALSAAYQAGLAGALRHPVSLADGARYWREAPEASNAWHAAAIVDFIMQSNAFAARSSSAAGRREALRLQLLEATDYDAWLRRALPPSLHGAAGERAWLRFLNAQSALANTAIEPLAAPSQSIELLCSPFDGEPESPPARRLRYFADLGRWLGVAEDGHSAYFNALPGDDGLAVQIRPVVDDWLDPQLVLEIGDMAIVAATGGGFHYFLGDADPSGSRLVILTFNPDTRRSTRHVLDVEACRRGVCELHDVVGEIVWSPDGRHTLQAGADGVVYLGDALGQSRQEVGEGATPFWLDATTYGFVAAGDSRRQARLRDVVVAGVDDTTPRDLVTISELTVELAEYQQLQARSIAAVNVSPTDPNRLLFTITRGFARGAYLFDYELAAGRSRLLAQFDGVGVGPITYSPDGRFATLTSANSFNPLVDPNWTLHVFDLAEWRHLRIGSDYAQSFPVYDWSADGRFLMRVDDGFVNVFDPATGRHQLLVHDGADCRFGAWVGG